ncbi:cytosolic phospholipase A2 gamma-like [Ctenopharyngodon idella]|uniref:cytosolic phospholipase A2 gamma-like n=1 Tax=Ctenopharyngodon idella TaxID=7959 RepID=UPI0022326D6D|nr:cytosolic phospholipase A2 gamma-like [Ctenopharyngodon idella]
MGASSSSPCKIEVRIEHSLNQKEEEFVARRRKTVQQSLKKLYIYAPLNKVPNIALLGSGGGERAMVGLLGSLVELQKTGLLDCILYLSGVSGSTWCMASLYQESDWSTKLGTVKDKIIQRLNGPAVSMTDAIIKWINYCYGTDYQNLTYFWAAMVITTYVKEIDERTVTDQWKEHSKDPFPIYTVIDKHCKQSRRGDPWFEITPYEAGYSLIGAFVETSSFGSKFENGCKTKNQPENDMLYLQALCGSALADEEENKKFIWEKMKGLSPPNIEILEWLPKQNETSWIWGKTYNFLYNMKDERVPAALLKSETREYEDAGLLLNSPYFSVLRKERDIDLIISLDFSDGDPFMTVKKAAEMCKELNIPFPEVKIHKQDVKKPKDFYVFKGRNAPTVIHIPLFNVINCGDDIETWRNKYATFQGPYSDKMIADLMKVARKNITNITLKLLEEICEVTETKCFSNVRMHNFL